SSGELWPVARIKSPLLSCVLVVAMILIASFTSGSSSPFLQAWGKFAQKRPPSAQRATDTNGGAKDSARSGARADMEIPAPCERLSESQLGIHTIRPQPPFISAIWMIDQGLTFEPVVKFDPTPPKTSMSGWSLRM